VLVVTEFVPEGLDLLVGRERFDWHEEIIGSALHLKERRDFSDGAYGVLREV
jgi:hypothetical protein